MRIEAFPIRRMPLEQELHTYHEQKEHLLGQYKDRYVLIKGDEGVTDFASRGDALRETYKRFGREAFLVKKVEEVEQVNLEGVSDLLVACQTGIPNSYRLIKRPITRSCMRSVLEKQIVRRTNRLIRVRRLICLLSIFCVFSLPTDAVWVDMPLVGPPAIGVKPRDAKRLQQGFEL